MIEIPPPDTIAVAALAVGALFLLRYVLVLRRIWNGSSHADSFRFSDFARALTPGAFGEDFEPERRYAKRQLVLGGSFLAIGLVLMASLLVTGAPIQLLR